MRAGRKMLDLLSKRARESLVLPAGDTLLAGSWGRLSSFTGEDSQRTSYRRPPQVWVGHSESAVFAFDRAGFSARAFLPMLTHATLEFSSITLQWVTRRNTAACVSIQDIHEADLFWRSLKQARDTLWNSISRIDQLAMMWESGSRPNMTWQNSLSWDDYLATTRRFIDDPDVGVDDSDHACGLVASPVLASDSAPAVDSPPESPVIEAAQGDWPTRRQARPKRRGAR